MRENDPEKLANSEEQVVKLLLTAKDSSDFAAVLGVGKGAVDFKETILPDEIRRTKPENNEVFGLQGSKNNWDS